MIALLGFLEKCKIFIEHFFLGEGDAINAHELIALLISTPISSGKRHYFYRFYRSRGRDMRTAAEVGKRPLGIGGDMTILKLGDQLTFIFFVSLAKHLKCIGL